MVVTTLIRLLACRKQKQKQKYTQASFDNFGPLKVTGQTTLMKEWNTKTCVAGVYAMSGLFSVEGKVMTESKTHS